MSTKNISKKINKDYPQQKKTNLTVENKKTEKWVWIALGIILFTTFAIYLKATKFELLYNWDDRGYVTENNDITGLQWKNIKLFFTEFYVGNYQPVTMLLYAIEHKLGAGKVSIYHLGNILLHILNTILVFIFVRKISPKNVMVALITAAFFAIHPMHVESVAWVAEKKDVLYSFFFLLSLIKYTDYLRDNKLKHLLFTGVFFTLSCMSKSAAVILPLVMVLLDYYLDRKFSLKMLLEKIPFFSISLIFGLVAMQSQVDAIQVMAAKMTMLEHILIVSNSFTSYLLKAFIPINLSAIYPYPIELGTTLPLMYYVSILIIGLLLFFVWYSRRWGKEVVFGFLFFVVTIILVLQFVPVGAATMADRYTYIPYIGVFFAIGKFYEWLSQHLKVDFIKYKKIAFATLVFGFLSFSVMANNRIKVWENDVTLFSDVIKKYPSTNIPYINRALYYMKYYGEDLNYKKKAIADFEDALTRQLNHSDSVKVCYSLGTIKYYLGDFTGSIKDFDKTIEVDAGYSSAYNNRGGAKFTLKDFEGALADYNKVIELNPQDAGAYVNRGKVKKELKDATGALLDFDNAIKIDGRDASAYFSRATIKNELQDYNGAIKDLDNVIYIQPGNSDAYTIRGYSKHMKADFNGALEDYNKAIAINPQNEVAIKNKALLGQF